jgi:hypothetical protein
LYRSARSAVACFDQGEAAGFHDLTGPAFSRRGRFQAAGSPAPLARWPGRAAPGSCVVPRRASDLEGLGDYLVEQHQQQLAAILEVPVEGTRREACGGQGGK